MLSNPDTLVILIAALAGGFLGRLYRLPGGALLVSTISVAVVCNAMELSHIVPDELLLIMQVLMGCMLGQSITRYFWRDVASIWKPCLMVIFTYSLFSAPFAFLLVKAYGFDPISALLGANPARMQDMIILAGSMNLDAVMVMLMQFCRQFVIIGVTPFMLAEFTRKDTNKVVVPRSLASYCVLPEPKALHKAMVNYAILLLPAAVGGLLGYVSGHAMGPLLGAFAAVAASRVIWLRAGEVAFPRCFAFIIQSLAGILLGVRITPDIGLLLINWITPLMAAVTFVLVAGLLISTMLHRCFKWNKALSWMAAAPGRASDMLAISHDIDMTSHDRLALACVHTVRQVYFTLFIPVVSLFL